MGGGFGGSKAILDVIKAQAAGERAQIDLQEAIQRGQAEQQLAVDDQRRKQFEEQAKAKADQAKQQAKPQPGPQPPDFVNINAGDPGRAAAASPQSALDSPQQATGGAGAQQVLQGLQANRQLPQGGGGGEQLFGQLLGSTQGTPQPAPQGGPQPQQAQQVPSLQQALGQQGPQQFTAPGRRNTVGFESTTGGGSLAEALGQPRNTVNFQSRSNAMTAFDAARLNQFERDTRFNRFNILVNEFGAGLATQADRAYGEDGIAGVARVLEGKVSSSRQLTRTQIRLMDAQAFAANARGMKDLADSAGGGGPGLSVVSHLRGHIDFDKLPEPNELATRAFKVVKDGKFTSVSDVQALQHDYIDVSRQLWLPKSTSSFLPKAFSGVEGRLIGIDDLMMRLAIEEDMLPGDFDANRRWLMATGLFKKDPNDPKGITINDDSGDPLIDPIAHAVGIWWPLIGAPRFGLTGSQGGTSRVDESGSPPGEGETIFDQIDRTQPGMDRTRAGGGTLPSSDPIGALRSVLERAQTAGDPRSSGGIRTTRPRR